ncbi:hypothetical protein [Nocardia tengchongensis]|uniref:Uncharacterized protein n=1 Tax=Nocardia tengchongensis TaxID=2055889 RepID=A0ABX8CZ48_9NOCA|nr:hypothetical protein [Nocardia tengchongensis]QVI23760.1 hypothetical protein KHQ06_13600 [Nocardia tengchongensis]
MDITGTWEMTVETPVGTQYGLVDITTKADGSLDAFARNATTGVEVAVHDLVLAGDQLTWRQIVKKPTRLNIGFTMTLTGEDEMTGIAKARMMPGVGKVVGRRVRRTDTTPEH